MNNRMFLKIKAVPENVGFIRNVVASFTVPLDPSLETISDIKTAISEAVTNAVVHGYKNKEGDVSIDAEIIDTKLYIKISDTGIGIDNVEKAMEDFFTTEKEEERSGLGFTIMKTYMDTLRVESKIGAGTAVFMTKELSHVDR